MASKFAPFPFPFGVGTDICHIPRISQILSGAKGAKFIKRILTEEELMAAHKARRLDLGHKGATFVAGRFAAKEAVMKAAPFPLGFHDIVVRKSVQGQPFAVLKGTSASEPDRQALLSISHDGEYATAVAIVALEEAWPRGSDSNGGEAVDEGTASGVPTVAAGPDGDTTT